MDNQQVPCVAHGTLLTVMWQPGWEWGGGWGKQIQVYIRLYSLAVHLKQILISHTPIPHISSKDSIYVH